MAGLPVLALLPGPIWEGDRGTTSGLLFLLAVMIDSQCWWWCIRRSGFKQAGQMTLMLSFITGVVFTATLTIQN